MSQAVADHLRRALYLLRRDGWGQRQYCSVDGEWCASGAIFKTSDAVNDPYLARQALIDQVGGVVATWNDAPGRTFEEVEAAFLKAIERERADGGA